MKKWTSGLLALLLTLTLCAGCGQEPQGPSGIYYEITNIDPGEIVLEADGNQIPAELYLYWIAYACSNTEYQINMLNSYYGLYSELLDENGQLIWDGELTDGQTLSQQVKADGENSALFYAAVENMAAEMNVALSDEDEAARKQALDQKIEQYGGQEEFQKNLERMGISQASYDRIDRDNLLFERLQDLVLDPASSIHTDFDGTAYVDHILLMTVNPETNEELSDEEKAKKEEKANELLSQLQSAGEDLEELFTQLADENGEDSGRAAETGYLVDENTNFVQEFKDKALELKVGEISDIVKSDYGFHIILRKALTDEQKASLAGDHLSQLLQERMDKAEVVRSDKLAEIDAGSFYTSYNAKIEELTAADQAEENGGTDTSGSADGSGTDASGGGENQ